MPRAEDDLEVVQERFLAGLKELPDLPSTSADQSDSGLVKELSDVILRKDAFAQDAGGQLYVFEGGVYRPHGEDFIARAVKSLLVKNGDTKRWSSHRAREVIAFIRVDAPKLWTCPPKDTLSLLNGLLELSSLTLKPHSAAHLTSIQLPVSYDPAASCPRWESFIRRVLSEDCRSLPYELVAASMRGDISDQKAVLLVGSGENGKSTLLGAIVTFLGLQNVSSLALQRLENDKFSVVRLLGKLANICADLPSDHLTTTSTFKALTGGDRVTAERKFGESFEFTPFARLLFSTNHYPQSKDSSQAFFRRWLVVPFDAVIEPHERIPNLAEQLAYPTELSGLLNHALKVLPNMAQRGGFAQSETTRAAAMEFREMTDPLAAWLERFTRLAPDKMVTTKDLLIAYNAASEESGRPPMSQKAFSSEMKRLRPTVLKAQRTVRGEMKWVFLGLEHAGSSSQDSHHSQDSSQISLEVNEREEERERDLTGRNAVNAVNVVNGNVDQCFSCRGVRYWRSIHGAQICGTCYPPANEALVSEWIEGHSPVPAPMPLMGSKAI